MRAPIRKVKFASSCIYHLKVQPIRVFLTILFCFFLIQGKAQPAGKEKIYQGLILDEVMVKAVQQGFDVPSFIVKIKKDTTFYKAFKTLRLASYTMYNDIEILDKKGGVKASLNSITHQESVNRCRTMKVVREKVTGDFYNRKKEYQYYTARLYAHLFFTQGKICNESNIVGNVTYKGTTKYEEQLRILIFNPGQRIKGIPGIGENVAIFEQPTMRKYKFYLSRQMYNGDDCYVFTAKPLPQKAEDVVINELRTWIRVKDDAIVARNYSLSFHTWFYDFDVDMKVKLKPVRQGLVPYEIYYKGNWHVFGKSREIANFTAIFSDFE